MIRLTIAAFSLALATGAQAQNACNWGGMRSAPTDEARQLIVTNDVGDRTASLYWIDFDGNPILYAEIPPNGRHVQQTLRGHVWVSQNSYGYCDVIFTVENNVEIVIQ